MNVQIVNDIVGDTAHSEPSALAPVAWQGTAIIECLANPRECVALALLRLALVAFVLFLVVCVFLGAKCALLVRKSASRRQLVVVPDVAPR